MLDRILGLEPHRHKHPGKYNGDEGNNNPHPHHVRLQRARRRQIRYTNAGAPEQERIGDRCHHARDQASIHNNVALLIAR